MAYPKNGKYMYEYKKCDNCHRMLSNGDKVTAIIPDVEVEGRYRKGSKAFRLKLSENGLNIRAVKVYCKKCLDVKRHFLDEEKEK